MRKLVRHLQFTIGKSLVVGITAIAATFAFHLLPFTKPASAQIPNPYVPCGDTDFPEFHTYRPYQASPCDQAVKETALFCGNNLVLSDSFTVENGDANFCEDIPGEPDKEICYFTVDGQKEVTVDLANAEFPILGNTELVDNSQGAGSLDNSEKTNEYVSWYLNGVGSNFAEDPPDLSDPLELSNLVNFAGPLKKLLSHRNQRDAIENTIEEAGDERHDQIVGCLDTGGFATCYPSAASTYRISDIEDEGLPPKEEDFDTASEWVEEYKDWRSILSFFFFSTPMSSTEDRKGNVRAETFDVQPKQNDVVLSNISHDITPADLEFAHTQESAELGKRLQTTFVSKDLDIDSLTVSNIATPPDYSGCVVAETRSNSGDDLFAGSLNGNVYYTADFSCTFDKYDPGEPDYDDNYCVDVAGGHGCFPTDWECAQVIGQGPFYCPEAGARLCGIRCNPPPPPQDTQCTKDIGINVSLVTETPKADEIWARLVAGTNGIFKRIFPRIGAGEDNVTDGPIAAILDIPGSTDVTYAASGVSVQGAPELYFPHIGSAHEYFLGCIQTTLRPKGFGDVCKSGAPGSGPPSGGTCPNVPDSDIPAKWTGAIKSQFINNLAINWPTKTECKNLESSLADECYNYVIKKSIEAGVNPAFSLAIWINESQASNYCQGGSTSQDFGIKIPSLYQNLEGQLDFFLGIPFASTYLSCKNQAGWSEPMKAFLSRFQAGGCDPNSALGNAYFDNIKNGAWYFVTSPVVDCRGNGGFSFGLSWPTDNSCP